MKREALIVYMPNTPCQSTLAGTIKDEENIRRFLTSSTGGEWKDTEIISLKNPTIKEVKCIINTMWDSDYTFVVFTGHGYIEVKKNSYGQIIRHQKMLVADGELVLNDLKTGASRQAMIIDACRKFEVISQSTKIFSKSMSSMMENFSIRIQTRKIFNKAVIDSDEGLTVLFSSKENESSSDDPVVGGAFISSLIGGAEEWNENKSGILTLDKAHELAIDYMQENFQQTNQHPTLNSEKRRVYFPFAIAS